MTISQTLFLVTLIVLSNTSHSGQVFCRISLNVDLSNVFIMVWLVLYVSHKENHTSIGHSHHIKVTCYQHEISLIILIVITWSRFCLPGFYRVRLIFHPFCTLLFGSKLLNTTHTQEWRELSSLSWKGNYLHKLFEIFCMEDLSLPLSWIYSISIYVSNSQFFKINFIIIKMTRHSTSPNVIQ